MTAFQDFLRTRLEAGGFTTEDTLASTVSLMREVVDAHATGMVAPLEGTGRLYVDGVQVWFEEGERRPLRNKAAAIRRIEKAIRSAPVEVVAELRHTTELGAGEDEYADLVIGDRDSEITRPVYLPGYVAWEHEMEHHDPLTDTFSLGMILASLACGLDFTQPEDLKTFVANRRNLFALNPGIHPVVARAIFRMTELDRHRRPQDLAPLLHNLQNYREQDVDFEFDLARVADFAGQDRRTKQEVVLRKLRERLFEISRRNRLLHFRPTMQTVNLTEASVPLSFDVRSIRPQQILVWNDEFHQSVVRGKPISLNRHLNFSEALYLPSVLDRIRADARRDQAEFGFAQLRLAVCFLHWANLKETPPEQFQSPLVLLPVRLQKKKGIRDTYLLEPLSSEAEVNPVVRHQFKVLYDIDLPETIDLATTKLDQFFGYLVAKARESEPAVTVNKIDRPRIALIHEKARRRLDQYRRRARLAGRGVRSFLDVDYSYDPANYNPLGITLFSTKVRPPTTQLREIIEEKPRPRNHAVPHPEPPVVEKERTFYSLKKGGEDNPYEWDFDLCNVTLANFKYRKMSLVRDYEGLLAEQPSNPAFEATFSLTPRPVDGESRQAPLLEDRFDVVPCDPTQATAIGEARAGNSYIIQGPPGTGKSQTITNLIADHVAQGKRVLFVCEKRAAIDVVYARLRQCGLASLCCLIHDSQTDKREFVMDLKQTYETALAEPDGKRKKSRRRQRRLLKRLESELLPLQEFAAAMQQSSEETAVPVRRLIGKCIQLHTRLPELSPIEKERLPAYAMWWQHRDRIASFVSSLREIQPDGVLTNHALRLLSPRLADADRPLELITNTTQAVDEQFACVERTFGRSKIPPERWHTVDTAKRVAEFAKRIQPVARAGNLSLLDLKSNQAREFASAVRKLRHQQTELAQACEATKAWHRKLPAEELPIALEQARAFENQFFRWLNPAWWRMRGILNRAYDFTTHIVRPSWLHVLTALEREYEQLAALDKQRQVIAEAYRIDADVDAAVDSIAQLQDAIPELPDGMAEIHTTFITSDDAQQIIDNLVEGGEALESLTCELEKIVDEDVGEFALRDLRAILTRVTDSLDDLPDYLRCMEEIAHVPGVIGTALRELPLAVPAIEAAVADATLQNVYRAQRPLQRFQAATHNRHVARLAQLYDQWLESNATEVHERAHGRFLKNMHVAGLPAAQLTAEQKQFKKQYNRGRRELEHEFGKSMRYKSIRDLVAGESGEVVKDLKPVWLMSPLSVSDTLPLDTEHFDVVIFDEASQITLEEAVPSVFRACQAIVVGDEMQLPPTDFFSAKKTDEDHELLVEEEGELIQYDLDSNSFLNHAARNLPSTMLGWHYRSRSESLISFSNWAFYDGRLLTVPDERLSASEREPLRAAQPGDGEGGAAELLQRSVSFHFMEHGVYEKRRNRVEADYIAHLVRALLKGKERLSIGIVAFSEAQQGEIEGALERLALQDARFRDLLETEQEREVDGQFVGLLVKNLENIQGDERDVIILSICYAYGPNGKMLMNFGPINKSGGEKRLNVAFSRAKHHMAVISSIHSHDITNDYNDGANCLKNYLRYAECVSAGDDDATRRVLRGMSLRRDQADDLSDEPHRDPVVDQIAAALTDRGYLVDRSIGQSHFRCDLAVRRDGDPVYRLGILMDTDLYYEQPDVLERDMMRPRLLKGFGWNVAFVLAKDWYEDHEDVLRRLLARIEGAEPDDQIEAVIDNGELDDAGDDEDADEELDDDTGSSETSVGLSPDAESPTVEHVENVEAEAPRSPAQEGQTRHFEFIGGGSRKFWEITLSGNQHTVSFGRLGTRGQTKTKTFPDAGQAKRDSERLIRSKLAKGYSEK